MWRTTFAFQNWHSAIELKRYMLRFIQEFPQMHTLAGVRRTKYNQYDSIARPIQRWLPPRASMCASAPASSTSISTRAIPTTAASRACICKPRTARVKIELAPDDVAMLTLGSIAADATYGGNDAAPELIRDRRDGAWALWDAIAGKAEDFGRPARVLQRRREQVGIVHADDARRRAVEAHRRVLRQCARHRRADDLLPVEVADVDRRALSAAFPRHAARHLHAMGLRPVHRREGRLCRQADGAVHRARDPDANSSASSASTTRSTRSWRRPT